jgi:hypothetical protein
MLMFGSKPSGGISRPLRRVSLDRLDSKTVTAKADLN